MYAAYHCTSNALEQNTHSSATARKCSTRSEHDGALLVLLMHSPLTVTKRLGSDKSPRCELRDVPVNIDTMRLKQ